MQKCFLCLWGERNIRKLESLILRQPPDLPITFHFKVCSPNREEMNTGVRMKVVLFGLIGVVHCRDVAGSESRRQDELKTALNSGGPFVYRRCGAIC